jgi:ubiquitin-protein ligase
MKTSLKFLDDYPFADAEIKTLTNIYRIIISKEKEENFDRYIQELENLQSKYQSKNLNTLLKNLMELMMEANQ